MFYGKFANEGDNSMNNLKIDNVEGDNRLSPGLQLLTTRSMLKMHFFFQPGSVIVFSIQEIILLSSEIKHSSYKHLRVVSV